jgi:UDP-N-acetyl-D-glucosamine dehydrogenase
VTKETRWDRILEARISSREAVVGIVGMGYVGVPLAMAFRRAGFPVIAFDVDSLRVDALNSGRNYIRHLNSAATLEKAVGRFEATTEHGRATDADAILLCLPTPLTRNREPDLSFVTDSAERLLPYLRAGQLLVLESTTYPGTTDEILVPILSRS